MKRSHAALALVGFACALTASACGADDSELRRGLKIKPVAEAVPVAGPVLHGEYVVWGTGSIEGGQPVEPIRIFGAQPGGSSRLLYELPLARNRLESLVKLAGSPNAVSFDRGWDICYLPESGSCLDTDTALDVRASGADVWVGAWNRRFRALEATGENCMNYRPDVDGTRVAFVASCAVCPCVRLGIDDVADAKPPRILRRSWEHFEGVRLAGNYVAVGARREISVRDLETDRKITYRPPLPPPFFWAHRMNDPPYEFDIQADGKAVAVWGDNEEMKTAWFSPEEPEAHALPFRPFFDPNSPAMPIRVAEDRIAFERKLGDAKSELVVADLGGKIQQVASFDRTQLRVGGFDFDGKRLTWASQEVLRSSKVCNGPPEEPRRDCWLRPVGPTTIYVAWLA